MNYPIWEIPSAGLLIAVVAILHVFVSHFAVGGGLFLVLAERKAYREHDAALLGFVRTLSRFFILLTLVFGAITGVGIWFTIGLVHPQATSSLINIFVWGWAIEWTFFVAEIAAAMVYYYGWAAAWLSLVVINGILAFMLTPGDWPSTHRFLDGFLNPTYVPSMVARTFVAVGLAGLYALLLVSWQRDARLSEKVGVWAAAWWVLPTAVGIPLSLAWFLSAAAGAGVPVAGVFGASGHDPWSIGRAVFSAAASGQPIARLATLVVLVAAAVVLVAAVAIVVRRRVAPVTAAVMMLAGLVSMGGGEWVREVLRKPYVIGQYMFVNGVRLPARLDAPLPPPAIVAVTGADRFSIDALDREGVLAASVWAARAPDEADEMGRLAIEGREVFKLQCSICHTTRGYLGIAPLVAGLGPGAIEQVVEQLARPVGPDGPVAWNDPAMRLDTWRGRQMPPFAGTEAERTALAYYLALEGGATPDSLAASSGAEQYFNDNCAVCHGDGADFQIPTFGRPVEELYQLLGDLPSVNDMMPSFEGTDEERRALAEFLSAHPSRRPAEVQR